ncbi:glycosyltransferase family 39 protein [Candidatus Poribacteria bacterium]|nr:glycosyltransferase family 39 protein [Candidatus Poribacteria bacterium]
MNDKAQQVSRFFKSVTGATAIVYVLMYLFVVPFRMRYPFEMEWLEGSLVIHVKRILAGQPLYVRPSLDFVPFFYTPLYFYLSAAVAKITGVGFPPLRLVAFVSSVGCFVLIALFVRRQTGSGFAALVSAGLFAATYRLSGAWLDIARVDSLFLLFLLAGLYLVKFGESARAWVLAAIVFSLAFLTKQTALAITLPVVIYCLLADFRRGLIFGIVAAAIIGISTFALDRLHDGWYAYYVFGIPSGHPLLKSLLLQFWTADILAPMGVACGMAAVYFCSCFFGPNYKEWLFYFLATGAMVGASWMSRVHEGGFDNVLLTAYAMIAVLFGLGADLTVRTIRDRCADAAGQWEASIYLVLLLQFAVLAYNPLPLIPTAQDEEAGWRLVDRIARIPGEVYVPYHSYLPSLAGKNTYAHGEALYSIMSSDRERGRMSLINEIREAVAQKKFQAAVFDVHRSRRIWSRGVGPANFEGYCIQRDALVSDENAFWPLTGVEVRPEILMFVCP